MLTFNHIAGNFQTFVNIKVLWLSTKDLSSKFGGTASFGDTSEQFASFLPQKFSSIQYFDHFATIGLVMLQ